MESDGKKYGLIITANKYKDNVLAHLPSPAKECSELVKVLEDKNIGGFHRVEKLINSYSSKICESFEHFINTCDNINMFFFYFCGYGIIDEHGKLYFAAKNTRLDALRSTAVPVSFLNELMEECHSKELVVILDCCFNHVGPDTVEPKPNTTIDIVSSFKGKTKIVISSPPIVKYAFNVERINGQADYYFFTQHLINGIKSGEADRDGDGLISVQELYDYICGRMEENESPQLPVMWPSHGEESIFLAKSPLGRKKVQDTNGEIQDNNIDTQAPGLPVPACSIARQGWKSVKSGKAYAFFFLYIALNHPAMIPEEQQEIKNKECTHFLNYISRWLKNSGWRMWLCKQENYEYVYLFPYSGKNTKKVFQCAFQVLLYKILYDFEQSNTDEVISVKSGLHFDSTSYEPNPENKILASSAVNFCFHFGEQLEPEYLYVTGDVLEYIPQEYHGYLLPAGNIESREIYRMKLNYIKEIV